MREPPIYVYVLTNDTHKWIAVYSTRAIAREKAAELAAAKVKVKRAKLTILG